MVYFFSLGLAFFDISEACSASEEELFPARLLRTGSEELSEVVSGRNQEPFGSRFGVSSKTELPEALDVLDLTDRRLGDAFSSGVDTLSF